MHSAMSKSNSIGNALFDITVQLTAPALNSSASSPVKSRASTTVDEPSHCDYSPSRNSRYSLSSLIVAFPRRSSPSSFDLSARQRSTHLTVPVDANNNTRARAVSIASKSEESLLRRRFPSPSPSPRHKSIKSALINIWQGFSHDDLPSTYSFSNQQHGEAPMKKVISLPRRVFVLSFTSSIDDDAALESLFEGRHFLVDIHPHPQRALRMDSARRSSWNVPRRSARRFSDERSLGARTTLL